MSAGQNDEIPAELVRWVTERLTLIQQEVTAANLAVIESDVDTPTWLLTLIHQVSGIEATAKRIAWLLSAYAIRQKITTATAVAQASDITISAATSRAGSALAGAAWREAFPQVTAEPKAKARRGKG